MNTELHAFFRMLIEKDYECLSDNEIGQLVRAVATDIEGGNPYFATGFEELCFKMLVGRLKDVGKNG